MGALVRRKSYYSCFEGATRVSSPVEIREIEIPSLLGTRDRILNGPKWITHKSRKLRDVGNSSMPVHGKPLFLSRHRERERGEGEHLVSIRAMPWYTHTMISSRILRATSSSESFQRSRKMLSSTSLSRYPRTSGKRKEKGRERKRKRKKKRKDKPQSSTNSRLSHSVFQKHRPFSGSNATLKACSIRTFIDRKDDPPSNAHRSATCTKKKEKKKKKGAEIEKERERVRERE